MHYTVIYDESGLSANDIQQGMHTMSYLYAHTTKAVSLVLLMYYADLVCELVQCYLDGFLNMEQPPVPGSSEGKSKGKRKAMMKDVADEREVANQCVYDAALHAWGNGIHLDLKETMWAQHQCLMMECDRSVNVIDVTALVKMGEHGDA
ncbi:hypothetical protein EDB19DRAFT_1827264 [Suillus lakei]|nr:hypothetical protein EDB19DRAFT_1827264 [Suillus lakei]